MDRNEALRLLKGGPEGVAEWNRRRAGELVPGLGGADLGGASLAGANFGGANFGGPKLFGGFNLAEANLAGADLGWANLNEANLRKASLNGTSLIGVDLAGAKLNEADLSGADLRVANLRRADLRKADLRMANLWMANLSGVNLSGADLALARCLGTVFADVDPSEVKGLDSVRHDGPSTIGIDTLIRSQGKIPEAFLRGCGVPDTLIAYLPSLVGSMSPIQFYSCFISYSTKDEDFANRLHSRMRDDGLRVWYSPKDIKSGQKLYEQIDQAIRMYEKLLLVLSPNSMNSEWVKTEIRKARKIEIKEGQRKLFPIRLVDFGVIRDWECFDADSGKDLGVEIREYFIPDFTNWKDHDAFEKGFARLLSDLKAEGSTAK